MRILLALCTAILASPASAFCGFYVASADGELFNEASKVVYVRDGTQSTITMSSDYQGPTNEFAMIVPTPAVLEEHQINTVDPAIVDHLDAYSAPRLVEYHDDDPCLPQVLLSISPTARNEGGFASAADQALGVTVEAEYEVGRYDIVILSAEQSDGLTTWLTQEGYNIPDGAEDVLGDYINMGMKFFVARVNLTRHAATDQQDLEPLQISFTSDDFMLPLQLGKVNSVGTQDVLITTITRNARVEAANYETIMVPSNVNVPVFVEAAFGDFYRDMFAQTAAPNTVVTEYAWDMAWCDPCAADPLSGDELHALGATWVEKGENPGGVEAYVTRLHIQYTQEEFLEDLMLRITDDRSNFQGRYIMNHPFEGEITCDFDLDEYVEQVQNRQIDEAKTLADLTGWNPETILARIAETTSDRFRR